MPDTPHHTPRHPSFARASALVPALLALALGAACGGGKRPSTADTPRCTDAESGTLRVTNQSGRMIEIHTWRTVGQRVFVGTASPGTTTFRVTGPSDLDVRYAALDPTRGMVFATVSWLRPHARGGSSQVLLDLDCVSTR